MKKKLLALLLVVCLAMVTVTPVFAASHSFTIGTTSGTFSLNKSASTVTGITTFGAGKSITATRTVEVTINCKENVTGALYTYTDKDSAITNTGNYTDTTASISLYRPSSSYTISSATSFHQVTSGTTYSRRLSV